MKLKFFLIFIALFFKLTPNCQSQTDILKSFPKGKLPVCISYSKEEQVYFGAIYTVDTVEGELQDVFEKSNLDKDESG